MLKKIAKLNQSQVKKNKRPKYIARSEINRRSNNEDSFQIFSLMRSPELEPITILAIADGMGGHANGKKLSWETLRKFSVSLFEEVNEPAIDTFPIATECQLEKILLEAIDRTNIHIRRRIEVNGWKGGGSTLVAAAIWNNMAVGVNLGDSPLYHYQKNSRSLTQITQNHNVTDLLLQAGAIEPEIASTHHSRNQLVYYVGGNDFPHKPPIHQLKLQQEDILLLCSDGISGTLKLEEIREILATPDLSIEQITEDLFARAKLAGATDNQTVILWLH